MNNAKLIGGRRIRQAGGYSSDMPLFSIITVVYNGAAHLEKTILSVLNQTYPNIEYIIIDGGSTDGTLDIIRRYDDRLDYWVSEPDEGMYDAINKGIGFSQGEIVAYLNSDDLYFPYTVKMVVDAFQQTKADIVYGDWANYHMRNSFLELLPFPAFTKSEMIHYGTLPQATVFIKRKIFEEIGFFSDKYRLLADNEFFVRAMTYDYQVFKIKDVLAIQTIHGKNLLAGNSEAREIASLESIAFRTYYSEINSKQTPYLYHHVMLLFLMIAQKTFSIRWRLLLMWRIVNAKLRMNTEWKSFHTQVDIQKISFCKMFNYFISKKRLNYPYLICPNFTEKLSRQLLGTT